MKKQAFVALMMVVGVFGALLPQASSATADTEGHWRFVETAGPVIDTHIRQGQADSTDNRPNDGWIGYSPDDDDDGEVERLAHRVAFNGDRESIVFIDDENHNDFNPGTRSAVLSVRMSIDPAVLNDALLAPNESWNVVQKGRFVNSGGQWKIQVKKGAGGAVFLQCVVNDDDPTTSTAAVKIGPIEPTWITSGNVLDGTCVLNRTAGELRAFLENQSTGESLDAVAESLPTGFGSVAPAAGPCGSPDTFGGHVVIGNKPLCPDEDYNSSDAFRGTIFKVRVTLF